MDHVKMRTSVKADKKELKRRAGPDPLEGTPEATSVPATSGAHTLPMDVDDAGRGATTRTPMDVDSATVKGPSTTEGAMPIPRELGNDILAAIPLLPNEWPLAKIDLILQNTDKYYMSWRRFLFVHELLRTFNEKAAVNALRTNATCLVEHLVEFLSEWIVTFVEPAREVTKVRDPELLFLHEKDYWFRAIWQDIHCSNLGPALDRDRPPVGLVRCICKDARLQLCTCIQEHAPIWINRTGWTPPAIERGRLQLCLSGTCTPHSCTNRCLTNTNHKKVTLAAAVLH